MRSKSRLRAVRLDEDVACPEERRGGRGGRDAADADAGAPLHAEVGSQLRVVEGLTTIAVVTHRSTQRREERAAGRGACQKMPSEGKPAGRRGSEGASSMR